MKAIMILVSALLALPTFQDGGSNKFEPAAASIGSADVGAKAAGVRNLFVDNNTGVVTKDCGSEQKPCRRIQDAINNASKTEETVIKVKAGGVYDEKIIIDRDNITLLGSDQKNVPKPILKARSAGATVSIKGTNITIKGFEITNGDKFLPGVGNDQTAISVQPGSKSINILHNDIHTIGQEYGKEGCCFKKGKGGKQVLMDDCPCSGQAHAINVYNYTADEVSELYISNNTISNLHLGQSEAISINGNVSKFSIQDNTIRNVDNIAIDIAGKWGDCPKGLTCQASGKVIHNDVSYVYADENKAGHSPTPDGCNRRPQFNPGQGANSHTMGAIYVDGGTGVTIDRNRVFCSGTGVDLGSENKADVEGLTVKNNLVYDNYSAGIKIGATVKNTKILNNSFHNNNRITKPPHTYDEKGTVYFEYREPKYKGPDLFQAVEFANNIVIDDQARPLISNLRQDKKFKATFKNNLFFSKSSDIFTNHELSFSAFKQWAGGASNEFLASGQLKSLFVDFEKYIFDLAEGSYAIDKGDQSYFVEDCQSGHCHDFLGRPRVVNEIDVGAFEHQKL